MSRDRGKELHDRATRGAKLSAAEQARLDAWYAEQDAAESATLDQAPSEGLAELRAQVDAALSGLQIMAREIQTQVAENERLRRENAALQQELSNSRTAQRA